MKQSGKRTVLVLLYAISFGIMNVKADVIRVAIDNIYYKLSESEATVTCYSYNESNNNVYRGNLVIPQSVYYNGTKYYIKGIDDYAFQYCSSLTSITIPSSVTSIGSSAFRDCSSLTSVTIPSSVTSIGSSAFHGCSSLTSLTIPSGVTSIGSSAFYGCSSLTSINIPSCVTSIGINAFAGCSSLNIITVDLRNPKYDSRYDCNGIIETESKTLVVGCKNTVIPNSVTSIGQTAFYGCTSLTSISIPNSVTIIGSSAFNGCTGLTDIIIPNSVTEINNGSFYGCSSLQSITIPNSVTSIGPNVFCKCSSLQSITIPNSVSSIGSYAFKECSNLMSINIPNSVKSIGKDALSNTPWFNNQPDGLVYAGKVAYRYKGVMSSNTIITLADGTLGIAGGAFSGCFDLLSINIPSSVTSIGSLAFEQCSSMTNITIPSTVTTIESQAFYGCTGKLIVNCNIPSHSFRYSSFSEVIIGDGVNEIGNSAFRDCSNLTSVTVKILSPVEIYANTFPDRANTTLYVPNGSKSAYESADYWKEFKEIVEMEPTSPNIEFADANVKALCVAYWDTDGDGELSEDEAAAVTSLGAVFEYKTNIVSFDELRFFTGINSVSFMGCTNLESVILPHSLTTLNGSSFYLCSNLSSIIIPSSVSSISGGPFNSCSSLASIQVEDANKTYDSRDNCNAIIETSSNTLISGCMNTIIPNSVTSIGNGAFYEISGLKSITLGDNVTSLEKNAFYACKGLENITIGNNVKCIGDHAFYWCTALSSVIIPASVERIDNYAFYDCSNLTSVTVLREKPATIGSHSFTYFNGNPLNATLYVPYSSKAAYEAADYWKDFKEIVEMAPENPNVTVTDISQLNNIIYIESSEERTGAEAIISFKMKNTAAIRGFQFDLVLPDGVTPVEDSGDYVYWLNADRAPKKAGGQYYHTLEVTKQTDGSYRFLCGAQQDKTFTGNDGEVAVLKVNIADDMQEGDYPITLKNIKLTETDISNSYQTDEVVSKLTVVKYIPGDISGDGTVDVSDYIGVANHILGNTPNGFNAKAADVNKDNVVDVSDYIGVANIILTGSIYGNANSRTATQPKQEEQDKEPQ